MTLTEFLLARIAEDEAVWRLDFSHPDDVVLTFAVGNRTTRTVPPSQFAATMRAECEAKRAIVEDYLAQEPGSYAPGYAGRKSDMIFGQSVALGRAIKSLAAVYAGHPDYDEAWRP